MLLRRAVALAALLVLTQVGTASAGVKIQLFEAGVEASVGMVADNAGNVYVLSDFMMVSKVAPDGTRTWVPFAAPVINAGSQRGRGLVWGPDDALWFTCNDVVCHVDANGGGLIDSPAWGYAFPGIDGSFWSVDSTAGTVTRMTTQGVATVFHGLPASGVGGGQPIIGPDRKMWFIYGDALVSVTSSGTITSRPLPVGFVHGGTMVVGSDGNFWLAIPSGVARVSPDGDVLGAYPLAATPTSLVLGPDGDVWFTYRAAGGVGRVTPSGRVSEFSDAMGTSSEPVGIVRAADGGMWIDAFQRPYVWRIDPDPPSAVTQEPSGIGTGATTLNATVNPRGGPASAYFEYGTTGAYGQQTPSQELGDGDADVLTSAPLSGLQPATTYHYRVVAVNGMRTVRGADRTLTMASVPQPPDTPKPPADETKPDADGDGYPVGVDCDDHASSVHPGALDKPGDAVDQDCVSGAAAWSRLAPPVDAGWLTRGRSTRFTRLSLGALPAKATVTLICRGPGCSFKAYKLKTRRATKHTNLLARMERSRLRRGAVVELRLAASGQATTIIRWRIGPPTRRVTACLAPGAAREAPCS